MRIIDADGHVAENSSLATEAIKRWPDHVKPSTDKRMRLMFEGRNYPEDEGPGAGCPPEHGISKAPNINCRSPEGVLGAADRDHIATKGRYPSLGLCGATRPAPTATRWCFIRAGGCAPPPSRTRSSRRDSPGSTTSGSRITAPP